MVGVVNINSFMLSRRHGRVSCQVADYGCRLKMDSGAEVLKVQALLLKVFLQEGWWSAVRKVHQCPYSLSNALGAL